jgi:hypothetical protein
VHAPDFNMTSFSHIAGLRYAMAGDMPSVDLLTQLEDRRRAIQWNDPDFIQLSDDMRSPVPKLTTEQEESCRPQLMALLHVLTERIAEDRESMRAMIPMAKQIAAQHAAQHETTMQIMESHQKITAIANKLAEVHAQMQDKLAMLGVDVAPYHMPEELFL